MSRFKSIGTVIFDGDTTIAIAANTSMADQMVRALNKSPARVAVPLENREDRPSTARIKCCHCSSHFALHYEFGSDRSDTVMRVDRKRIPFTCPNCHTESGWDVQVVFHVHRDRDEE